MDQAIDETVLPLPSGWVRKMMPPPFDSKVGYFNMSENAIHHQHPLVKRARESVEKNHALPPGWEKHLGTLQDGTAQTYYSCKAEQISTWDHPCLRAELDMILLEDKERRSVPPGKIAHPRNYSHNQNHNNTLRLKKDMCCVNLMNHHRVISLQKSCDRSPTPTPTETMEFNTNHVCSRFVSLLQHNVSLLSRVSHQLLAKMKFEESVRFGYYSLHTLMSPFSSSVELITDYLTTCVQLQKADVPNSKTAFPTPASLFTTGDTNWDPSKTPLVACKPKFSFLTQSILTYTMRSDVVSFFRRIWSKPLSANTAASNPSTASYDRKLQLRKKETILDLVGKLFDSLFGDDSMARVPQPIVELSATLNALTPGSTKNSEAMLLNLLILPSLAIVLADKNDKLLFSFDSTQFIDIAGCYFEWFDHFISNVSVEHADIVPKMSVEQFGECFDCESWCGVLWVAWNVMQRSFDINSDGATPDPTSSDADDAISSLARSLANKTKTFLTNINKLSNKTVLSGQPFLPPKQFSLRLKIHKSTKCSEMVNLVAINLGELLFLFDNVQQCSSVNGAAIPILKEMQTFLRGNGLLANEHSLKTYSGHYCLLKLAVPERIGDNDNTRGAFGLVPPPPPPLSLAGEIPQKLAENRPALSKEEVDLQRGMGLLFKYKSILEGMKAKKPLTTADFGMESGGDMPLAKADKSSRKSSRRKMQHSEGVMINGKVFYDVAEEPPELVEYQSVVVCDTNFRRTVVRNSTLPSDDPLTHYERNLLFMGQLRKGEAPKPRKKTENLNESRIRTRATLNNMLKYNHSHHISAVGSNYGHYNNNSNNNSTSFLPSPPKKSPSRRINGSSSSVYNSAEKPAVEEEEAALPFPAALLEKLHLNNSHGDRNSGNSVDISITREVVRDDGSSKEGDENEKGVKKLGKRKAKNDAEFGEQVEALLTMLK